jgi:hypothetical protein
MRDSFGKMRVSEPYTLLDLRFPGHDSLSSQSFLTNSLQISYKTVGNANYTAHYANCIFSLNGTGSVTSQSRQYCVYQPGKSLLIMASAVIGPNTNGTSGYYGRVGYYDDNDGLYFQSELNSSISVCVIKGGINTIINQTEWNIDKMDGTGVSGLHLDITKAQLFVIDMEWLGVGRIRYGFYAYGKIHYCHQVLNINVLLTPYTNNINLPIRHELIGSASTTGTATFTQICSTVISEGGYNSTGRPFTVSGLSPSLVAITETPVLAIRGGGGNYNHQIILPTTTSVLCTGSNDICQYRIRLYSDDNASSFTSAWSDVNVNSVCQSTTTFGLFTTTNSIIVDQDFVAGKTSNSYKDLSNVFADVIRINANINNVSDVLVLTLQSLTNNNINCYSKIGWSEIY